MNNRNWSLKAYVVMGCFWFGGCTFLNIFSVYPAAVTINGHRYLKDNADCWDIFVDSTNYYIRAESLGKKPMATSWNQGWLEKIEVLKKEQQNGQRYINYIIEGRRRSHLPELHGI